MNFVYEREGTNGFEVDKTRIKPDRHSYVDEGTYKQVVEMLPSAGIPHVEELLPDEVVLLGIFHRRIVMRALRGEDVQDAVRQSLGERVLESGNSQTLPPPGPETVKTDLV